MKQMTQNKPKVVNGYDVPIKIHNVEHATRIKMWLQETRLKATCVCDCDYDWWISHANYHRSFKSIIVFRFFNVEDALHFKLCWFGDV